MQRANEEIIIRLSDVLVEAKSAGISEDQLKNCLSSITELDDPIKKGCKALNCLVFQIYPIFFLLALLGYPLFNLFQGSPCLITEVTPLGEAMIPVMNCR